MSDGNPRILLVIGGGIAAYKSCELVRLIRKGGGEVTCVVTEGGQQFVTPMALAALSENPVHTTLWDLKNEAEMGHIQLSREADLVVVCPATADMMAKMAAGIADDLATTLILATDKPVMAVPAMNVRMWEHEATQRNVTWLRQAGVQVLDPDEGPMACGEFGYGRLPDPDAIWASIAGALGIELPEPEVAPQTVAAAPAPAAETGAGVEADEEYEVEALEPEEEEQPTKGGGLGGLLSSLIPRSTPKRSAEEIEAEWLEEPEAEELPEDEPAEEGSEEEVAEEPAAEIDGAEGDESADEDAAEDTNDSAGEGAEPDAAGEPEVDPDAVPDLGGPLLASKGAASSAPPTDPEAINHTVKGGGAPPEPIEEDAPPAAPQEVEADLDDAMAGEEFKVKKGHRPLKGRHVVVTAGPTWEALDPVRYIANRSSGKQGFAIAAAATALGAKVTLVAGPVALKTPDGVDRVDVESADEMSKAVKHAMPADVAVMVAAVADWKPKEYRSDKLKKRGSAPPALVLVENPDILTNIGAGDNRPELVVGFAAETENVLDNAKKKRKRKAADWIVANDVSGDVMGGDRNRVHIVSASGVESLDDMPKTEVAMALVERMADRLNSIDDD